MPLTAMTASRKLTFFAIVGVRRRRNITVHDVVGGSAADLNEPYGSNERRAARWAALRVPSVGAGSLYEGGPVVKWRVLVFGGCLVSVGGFGVVLISLLHLVG